ncbi:hypothetical protein [Limibacillus sp. MBR-115]|jgi:hypothetical protein|uniref:hypothetical protein n=1 Tax=Limibacillus sp. MBR-115 TaxID=3156465 RepID=UPI003396B389
MRQFHKSTVLALLGLGALVLTAEPSFAAGEHSSVKVAPETQIAHMGGDRGGQRTNQPCSTNMMMPGQMGQGQMGQGMMAPGQMGQGMMGQGMMGQGMMGQGKMGQGQMGQGMMAPGYGEKSNLDNRVVPSRDLGVEDVRHFLEHRLEMQGNKRLKLGEVREVDGDKIVADIVTLDGSLVHRIEVDRHDGQMRPAE